MPGLAATLTFAAACLAAVPTTPPPTAPPTQPRPEPRRQTAFVITLAALDTARASREFHAAMDRAADSKAPGVLLVLAPDLPWRTDLIRDALLRFKDHPAPIAVYLDTPRNRDATIPLGSALLALASAHAGAPAASISIRVERDEEARSLVAEKTDWDGVETDLRELLAPHLARRKWLDRAVDVLLWPRTAWWCSVDSRTGTGLHLAEGDKPAPALNERLVSLAPASRPADPYPAFTVSAMAIAGVADPFIKADDWRLLGKAASLKPPTGPDATIEGTLGEKRADAFTAHDELIRLRKAADESLDAAEKDLRNDEETPRRLAAADRDLARLDETLTALESLLAETPEVLRTLPPGKTPTAGRPASQPTRWRSLVQSHRDAAAKLRDRLATARKAAK